MGKREESLARAKALADDGLNEPAWNLVEELMLEEPRDGLAVMMGSYIMHKSKRLTLSYYLAHWAVKLDPGRTQCWMQLGLAAKHLWQMDEAIDAFRKAIAMSEEPKVKSLNYSNLASAYIEAGRYEEAEPIAKEGVRLDPDQHKARANLGICMIARRDWAGWPLYSACAGMPMRDRRPMGREPDWDGTKGAAVLVYPEQGLGDEVSFASMFPDVIRDSERVIIECEPKLEGLFRRSFACPVYGTRRTNRESWDEIDRHVDYSTLAGELGKFYRTRDADFPRTPYLTPDPLRRIMWRALFDAKKKPVIGIAWTGGIYNTAKKLRRLGLEEMLPIFNAIDAHWVSLQYTDAQAEIDAFTAQHKVDLVQYPYATLTPDYDDTAALVAECDLVICMQTCILHLCGAIGKECWAFIPQRSQWRYGTDDDDMIWYHKGVKLIRQNKDNWKGPIDKVANALRARERKAA